MKLTRFRARKVYGYLNFDVEFNQDISFMVGVNGSGKTTVIRLIQALLTASARDLNMLTFSKAALYFKEGEVEMSVSASTNSDSIKLNASWVSEPLFIAKIDVDDLESSRRGAGYFEELSVEISNHPVGKALAALNAPIVLGLERRTLGPVLPESAYTTEFYRHSLQKSRRRIYQGTLGVSLMETQALVQEAYRKNREVLDRYNARLRDDILISSFKYVPITSIGDIRELSLADKQKQILDRRTDIERALAGVVESPEINQMIGTFFDQFSALLMRHEADDNAIDLELLVNRAQIDRIASLIQVVDGYASRVDRVMLRLNNFLSVMNDFYSDTGKRLSIDTVGILKVIRRDEVPKTVEALSSGERQLLVIFSNLMFRQPASPKGVFIIDEPELSLHLKWQAAFIDSVIKASPGTQLIVATHSPEIIGGFKRKAISINGGLK